MAEPIAYSMVTARLRTILQAQTRIDPAATMQLRILANHHASVLWWLGQGRGHAVVWYQGEQSVCGVHTGATSYFAALDQFCQVNGIPPLDTRQPYAKVWEAAQLLEAQRLAAQERAQAATVTLAAAAAVVEEAAKTPAPNIEQMQQAVIVSLDSVPPPPVQLPPIPPQNGRARLRSQLEFS